MRITIGKFDDNGEVVWFDVESDDHKTPEGENQNVGHDGLSQQSDEEAAAKAGENTSETVMKPVEEGGLGMKEVLDYVGVRYE